MMQEGPSESAIRPSLAAFMLLFLSGCAVHSSDPDRLGSPTPSHAPNPRRPCEIPLAAGVVLSPLESCRVKLLKRRCSDEDLCLVDCFANSKHRPWDGDRPSDFIIGGGCWHHCFAYRNSKWTEPDEWQTCKGLDWNLPTREVNAK